MAKNSRAAAQRNKDAYEGISDELQDGFYIFLKDEKKVQHMAAKKYCWSLLPKILERMPHPHPLRICDISQLESSSQAVLARIKGHIRDPDLEDAVNTW